MRVLLSIRPQYAKRILDGQKRYEFRRMIFREARVTSVVMYVTLPVGLIVGEFEIQDILYCPVDELWELTSEHAGISKNAFYGYFSGKCEGYAIQIGQVYQYPEPLPLSAAPVKRAPQSFAYIP